MTPKSDATGRRDWAMGSAAYDESASLIGLPRRLTKPPPEPEPPVVEAPARPRPRTLSDHLATAKSDRERDEAGSADVD
jgi:hypothetical protein